MLNITSCAELELEPGEAKIYITKSVDGAIILTPENVQVDKKDKKLTFAFGISRSGRQVAESYSVELSVDNENVPDGTIPLKSNQYLLTTAEGEALGKNIKISDGSVHKSILLTLPAAVFNENIGKKLSLNLRISNPSKYELNENMSEVSIVADVSNFVGSYVDVTKRYLKNTSSPFSITPDSPPIASCDPYQQTPLDWIVNDVVQIHEYQGKNFGGVDARCYGNRNWLSAGNFDYYTSRDILNGKIYQVVELPEGDYRANFEVAEARGGEGHAAFAVAKGNTLPNFTQLTESIVNKEFTASQPTTDFKIDQSTTVSIGFIFNIPKGVQGAYAISNLTLSKRLNIFND